VKAQAPHVPGTVHLADDDGLGWSYADIYIVSAVHSEAEAGADLVARDNRKAKRGNLPHMLTKLECEPIGTIRIVPSDACPNSSYVTLGGRRDDQGLGGDCPSPSCLMSARNSLALE
jgi:hypothetical protein